MFTTKIQASMIVMQCA